MPPWGRPPGAQRGRQTGRWAGPWMEGDARIEEIDSEDEYLLQDGRGLYAKQLAGMDVGRSLRWRKRMLEYDDLFDETESIDGRDYNLHEDGDSTVAYAIQLAMKNKEEQLVESALERIRRAQRSGQKNVRLSKRELDALERKRMGTSGKRDSERRKPSTKSSRSRESSTSGISIVQGGQTAPYQSSDSSLARSSGTQSRQSQQSTSPPRPSPYYSERYSSISPRASLRGTVFTRALPDDTNWVPPYPLPYLRDQLSHAVHNPVDPFQEASRRSSSYISGYPAFYSRPSSVCGSYVSQRAPSRSRAESSHDKEQSDSNEGDRLHIVDMVERKVPTGPPSRTATGRGSRQRHFFPI